MQSSSSETSTSSSIPRILKPLETYGFGLAGPPGWTGLIPATKAAIGFQSIFVWIPAALVGLLINYQVKHLGMQQVDVSGGTPNYITRLLHRYPAIAAYAAIGYLLNWVCAISLNAVVLTDLVAANLKPFSIEIPTMVIRVFFMLLPFIVAMTGTRALSILLVCFIFPSIGLLVVFSVQGIGWLLFAADSPGFFPTDWNWGAMGWNDWAKWFFFATFVTYSSETASSFVADSRRPAKTLRFLDVAGWIATLIFIAGTWVVLRLAPTDSIGDVYTYLSVAAQPFWGESSGLIITFLLAGSCLLTMATAVSNAPRILYQLAQDKHLAPVLTVVSQRGVFGPALTMVFALAMVYLLWGNVPQIVVVGNVGWFVSFTLMQLALWLQRGKPGVFAPKLALGIFLVQSVVLFVGGLAWGWQDFLIGLFTPVAILLIDTAVRKLPFAPFKAQWWINFYRPKPQVHRDLLMFQVITLIVLVCGALLSGWGFRELLWHGAIKEANKLILVLLIVVAFVGVAIACWTTFPQVLAAEEARQQTEKLNQELEQRVEERTVDLKKAIALADSANRAKSDFLANMSHELRTPLNGILGYAQILQRSQTLAERDRRGVNIIDQCGSHLLNLINDVLDLSKIEANKLELHPTPAHLPSVLQSVVEICRIKAEQKGLEFIYDTAKDLPTGVLADEKRLRQVLINLLGNAIKFTDRGEVTLRITPVTDVQQTASGEIVQSLCFQVRDTGVGMSPAQLEKIFKPFEQVGDTKKQSEGTGLGLSISQRIVETMGGQIQVRSQENVGSIFEFIVEFSLSEDVKAQQSLTEQRRQLIGYQGDRKTILIIDDSWENRSVVLHLLEPLGFTIVEACDGEDGLLQAKQHHPDLIITDLAMPKMNGWDFLRHLRQTDGIKEIVAIVSSASVFELDRQKSIDAGGTDFLPKPLRAEDLYSMLSQHLAITWIEEKPQVLTQKPSNVPMILPPLSELTILMNCAKQGRIKAIQDALTDLSQKSEDYHPFIEQISEAVKGFNIQKIRQALQESINQVQ
jgi:signal transduction histidine kinase/FixJ family two-component response regulator